MTRHSADTIPTDPFIYKGTSAAELGYDPEQLESNYYEWRSEDGQRVGVYATQPRMDKIGERPETTIIMQASHDYRLELLWMTRADTIASRTNTRVICVETPGTVGLLKANADGTWEVYDSTEKLEGTKNTLQQGAAAAGGNFHLHAGVQLDAIQATAGLDPAGRLVLLGESMGAAVAVDTLKEADDRGLNVSDVVLSEMVNTFEGYDLRNPLHLARILPGIENVRRNKYFDENKEIGHPMVAFEMASDEQKRLDDARKSSRQQLFAAALNGIGMAKGKRRDVVEAIRYFGPNRPELALVRGRESVATRPDDYEGLVDALRDIGMMVTYHEVTDAHNKQDIGHAHAVSLGRQATIADWLNRRLNGVDRG